MGVEAGIFKMTNVPAKTADSADLSDQESDLAEAYSQSASQDKLIASKFEHAIGDGLKGEAVLFSPIDEAGSGS